MAELPEHIHERSWNKSTTSRTYLYTKATLFPASGSAFPAQPRFQRSHREFRRVCAVKQSDSCTVPFCNRRLGAVRLRSVSRALLNERVHLGRMFLITRTSYDTCYNYTILDADLTLYATNLCDQIIYMASQ